jgi:hypothetical protein
MPKFNVMRILGALAVVAALSLAPSFALAHAGHVHNDKAAASTQKASAPAATKASQPAAKAAQTELSTAPALPIAPMDDTSCGGYGCCFSGPCTGCYGCALTSVIDWIPPTAVSLVRDGSTPPGTDYRDGRLRRPPKSFV